MSQKQGSVKKERKRWKYLKAPFRILAKAKEFYIKGMSECSDRVIYGNFMGCPTPVHTPLPRSFSVSSTKSSPSTGDNDLRELIRVASTRSLENYHIQGRQGKSPNKSPLIVPRSQSVGIGRIDEDEPCEFQEDDGVYANEFPRRSRSYAVGTRKTRIF